MAAVEKIIIYALCDPVSGERRYIGKTTNIGVRRRQHRWEAKSSPLRTYKVNWLRSLPTDPVVEILEEVHQGDWQDAERRWIQRYKERLTNFADGGQTSPVEGKGHTEESKDKMRMAALQNGAKPPSRRGQIVTDETREKLRISSLRRGNYPPPMGGWNKGIHKAHCRNGHGFNLENTVMIYRKLENRLYQGCKMCRYNAVKKYQLTQKGV